MVHRNDALREAARLRKTRISNGWRLFLVCIALIVLQTGCQEGHSGGPETAVQTEPQDVTGQIQAVQEVSGDVPRVEVQKNVIDFGEIGPGTVKTGKFTFKNVGQAPLKILQVKSCCGVSTKGVKKGQVYRPGKSGALEFSARLGARLGPANRDLYLTTNDPNQERVKLTIKAKIVQRVAVEPAKLKFFVKMENGGAKDITLTSLDGKPFAVTAFRSTANAITADFDPAKEATKFVLKPKLDLEKLPRYRRGQVSIDLTHPMCKNLRISYDVLPEFTLDTSQIIIFKSKPGEAVERRVWVLSNSEADFDIESISTTEGIVNVKNKKKEGNRYELTLEFTPPTVEEGQTAFIDELQIKIKGGETLTAKVRLFYS